MKFKELKLFLDEKAARYEQTSFLTSDPIQIPHRFSQKEDIEIAGFIVASIAWGNRLSIIKSGSKIIELMENDPFRFVLHHSTKDLIPVEKFVHRTFKGIDLNYFIKALKNLYQHHGGLEAAFTQNSLAIRMDDNIHNFRILFFELAHEKRTEKHIADPKNGSAAKRINMFLRWMVRSNKMGVDFGLWKTIQPSQLSCPLDVHTGNVARSLGLLKRKQNDQKAVMELDTVLRKLDPHDPVKYDFALFGLGVFEHFS